MPEVIFAGPEGRLEGRYQQGKEPNSPIAIVLAILTMMMVALFSMRIRKRI